MGDIATIEDIMLLDRDIYLNLLEAHLNKDAPANNKTAQLTADEIAAVRRASERNKAKMTTNGNIK